MIAGESCKDESESDLCASGLECAQVSRSDTNYNCCDVAERCNVNKRCCNGAYGPGERCPSGSDKDCESGLRCVRTLLSANKICCNRVIVVPILGEVCDRFAPPVSPPAPAPTDEPTFSPSPSVT